MINIQHSALLLIEFQNEWLTPNGKLNHLLTDKHQFLIALQNARSIIQCARKTTINVIHSGLSYTHNYKELGEAQYGLRAAIPMHKTFLSNTSASEFTPPFTPQDNEFTIKGRMGSSAFSASNLDAYFRNHRINTIFIMGYALHVCVESTLRAAHDLGYETVVIEDASCAFTKEQKHYFLNHVIHHFGHSMKSDEFITQLERFIK